MNGTIKFHKANGPAFNPGEKWMSVSGRSRVEIISTRCFGEDKWDYCVTYQQLHDGRIIHDRDAWNFQVRYQHIADDYV